ncbi:MAG: DUF86 domain-containing protein [Methanothrix sp.]|nr:DUF86 domain-containing protein [Methanothrix sp.]
MREMDEALGDWERYMSLPLERLLRERDLKNMVLHALLVSIQASIDIANHLISEEGLRRPANYREAFQIIGEAGLIDDDLARELSDLAGFRNVLVHIYWESDMEMVYHILQNDRNHLVKFREEVKHILLNRSRGGQ